MISFVFSLMMQANASIPTQQIGMSPMELLSMPDSNRVQIAKTKSQELYPEFINIAFSNQRSIQTRWKALITAAQINPTGVTADLQKALQHKDWFMRNAALVSLKSINPRAAEKTALTLMNDKALLVRSAAIRAISDQASGEVRNVLWGQLRSDKNFHKGESLWIRAEIVEKLSVNPQKNEYSSFVSLLNDRDENLVEPALSALEKLSHKKLGTAKSTIAEKKKLWVKYSKQHSVIK